MPGPRSGGSLATASAMLNDLVDARAQCTLGKAIKRDHQLQVLFQVLSQRYERASTLITTNRTYKDWNKTFATDNAIRHDRRRPRPRRPPL